MDIIHHMVEAPLPRLVAKTLEDRLAVMPAVVLTGARQTGKTVLAQGLEPEGRRYRSLDDPDILDAARRDPESLLDTPGPDGSGRGAARARTCSMPSSWPSTGTGGRGASC